LPEDKETIKEMLVNNSNKKTYIAKPSKGFGGHGIVLMQKITDFPDSSHDMVV
jgi:predicted ATP-grasp superfamily ATP-dependent carboligase